MTGEQQVVFWRRALRVARSEIAALTALLVVALGVMTFVEVADDMTEADGQAFDQMVLQFPVMADYCILNLDGRTFYATHGHIYNENNLPPIQEGDILIHGHTHVLKAEQKEGYVLLNPGSVSIPKEGNPPTYAIFEDGVFTIKDFEGNIVKSIEL